MACWLIWLAAFDLRRRSSRALLDVIYSDSRSAAVIKGESLSETLADARLFAFGTVSTEQGPKSVKAGRLSGELLDTVHSCS